MRIAQHKNCSTRELLNTRIAQHKNCSTQECQNENVKMRMPKWECQNKNVKTKSTSKGSSILHFVEFLILNKKMLNECSTGWDRSVEILYVCLYVCSHWKRLAWAAGKPEDQTGDWMGTDWMGTELALKQDKINSAEVWFGLPWPEQYGCEQDLKVFFHAKLCFLMAPKMFFTILMKNTFLGDEPSPAGCCIVGSTL